MTACARYLTGTGQVLKNVHCKSHCEGRPCVIHAPSNHHMSSWPTHFRTEGPFDIKGAHMERICIHGVGHPDPDDVAFNALKGRDYSVHGCDGCCHIDKEGSECLVR